MRDGLTALRSAGRSHSLGDRAGATVEGVEVVTEEGGVGWSCMFCGSSIEGEPLRISVHWTDDGVDGEQWYAAHRRCLLDRVSPEELFAPQFAQ